jgi:hypothetical protein
MDVNIPVIDLPYDVVMNIKIVEMRMQDHHVM